VDVKQLPEQIASGELDQMNEQQFMVFTQRATRAMTSQRDVPLSERGPILDQVNNYLAERLERDEGAAAAYLHEVGDWLTLSMNAQRPTARKLRQQFAASVQRQLEAGEMSEEFRTMPLFRIAQIAKALPQSRPSLQPLFKLAMPLFERGDEPKPILAVFRLLEVLTNSPHVLLWSNREQQAMVNLIDDAALFSLDTVNVKMRVQLLRCLSQITKFSYANDRQSMTCQRLMGRLVDSIKEDIQSLDERPVLEVVALLSKLYAQGGLTRQLKDKVLRLSQDLHGVVCDMAVENAHMVETSFLVAYLKGLSSMQSRLDSDKTSAFLEMFRAHC